MFRLNAMSVWCISRMAFVGLMAIGCGVHAANYRPDSKAAGEDLFVTGVVPRLSIEIPPESLVTLRSYHQVWRQARPQRVDVPITIREGKIVYTNVAAHLKGSFSYRDVDSKPSLTLNFDKFAPGQRFHGLQKIHLNNAVQDPSYLLEQFGRELFNEAGVPTTRAGHAVVKINGREAGLYVLLEGWNKQFIKRHFESAKGNLYDGGSGGDITKKLKVDCGDNPEDRSGLTNLVRATREKHATNRLEKMARVLNVERFRTFAALETMLVHWDGYCAGGPNNYRVFHDVSRDKMVFMPHGMDQLFGVSSSTDFSILPAFKGMVADKLFSIPSERQRYREEVARLLNGPFSVENLHARLDRLSERLQKQLGDEPQLRNQVKAYVGQTKSRMQVRVASIRRQLNEPEKTFAFDKTGTAQLTTWRFKGANDHPAGSA
jgi:spore coat protein H